MYFTDRLGHAPITDPNQLNQVTRAQLQHGDCNIRPEGNQFRRGWSDWLDRSPPIVRSVPARDLAATAEGHLLQPLFPSQNLDFGSKTRFYGWE
jgi:hypothetical protein